MEKTPDGRVVHTRNAMTLDSIDVCLVEHPVPGSPMFAMALSGTIHTGPERASCLTLFSPEGAGVMIDRIISMAGVLGPEYVNRLLSRVQQLNPVDPHPDPDLHTEPPLTPEPHPASVKSETRVEKKVA